MEIIQKIHEIKKELLSTEKLLNEKISDKARDLEKLDQEITKAVSNCKSQIDKFNQLKQSYIDVENRRMVAENQIKELGVQKVKAEKSKENMIVLENKKKALESEVSSIQKQHSNLSTEIINLKSELDQSTAKQEAAKAEKNRTISELNSLKSEIPTINAQLSDLNSTKDQLNNTILEKNAKISESELNLSKLEDEKKTVLSESSKIKKDVVEKTESLKSLSIECDNMNVKMNKERKDLDSDKAKINQEAEKLNVIKKELLRMIMDHKEAMDTKRVKEFIKVIQK